MLLNAIVHSHCCNIPLSEYTTSYPFYIGGHLDCLQLGLSHFILVHIFLRMFLLDIYLEIDCFAHMLYKC